MLSGRVSHSMSSERIRPRSLIKTLNNIITLRHVTGELSRSGGASRVALRRSILCVILCWPTVGEICERTSTFARACTALMWLYNG